MWELNKYRDRHGHWALSRDWGIERLEAYVGRANC